MKPLYTGHPWDVANWLLYKGGLIIQCTLNREVLCGTLLGGCFQRGGLLIQVCDMAALDRFHCTKIASFLGVSRSTIYRRLEENGISRDSKYF